MRLSAYIAAVGCIVVFAYFMVSSGYMQFLRTTHSAALAQGMVLFFLLFTTLCMIWLVRKLP